MARPSPIDELIVSLERFMNNYDLVNVYRALHYLTVETALLLNQRLKWTKPPVGEALPQLTYFMRRNLLKPIKGTLEWMWNMLSEKKPLILEEGNVERLARELKESIWRPVDTVIAYDGLSILELATLAAYMRSKKTLQTVVSITFVNPPGVTRFMSEQAPPGYRRSLSGVASLLARELSAGRYEVRNYVDDIVHEHGGAGWSTFLEQLDIKRIAQDLASEAAKGCLVVFSDHGYDVVLSRRGGLYVTHGHKLQSDEEVVVLPFSRFSFVLVAFRSFNSR